MSLRAPIAVSVEVRVPDVADRRVFRLAYNIGADGLRLERPVPFEVGRPVGVAFTLPDAAAPIGLRAEVTLTDDDGDGARGGSELAFLATSAETRDAIHRYVIARLGLPGAL